MSVGEESNLKRSTGWIAAYTKPNQEKTAIINIMRQGFEAYCPMIERTRRHARKIEQVKRPLFPSYVFIRIDEANFQWRSLLYTTGVQSVVQFNNQLSFIPEGFVEELQKHEKKNRLRILTAPQFLADMEVKMLDGLFQNSIAKVLSAPDKDRIWLLLDIMGRKVRTQHDVWSITHI